MSQNPFAGHQRLVTSFLISGIVMIGAIAASIGYADAASSCTGTSYSVTSSAPPASANWTSSSGLWNPSGAYPGFASCDSASDTNSSPTTLIVNSVIPNGLNALTLACNGCVIDIEPGGQLTVGGSGTIGSGATVLINGGTLVVNASAASGGLAFQSGAQLHLNNGTIAGTGVINMLAGSSLTYDGAVSSTFDGVTIASSGSIDLSPTAAATLTLTNGSTINNAGVLTLGAQLTGIAAGAGGNALNNSGTVQKNAGGTTTISVPFNNLANAPGVQLDNGVVAFNGGGTGDAPFNLASSGTLEVDAGSYTMTAGGVISGAGTLLVTGGTLSIGGVTSPANYTMSGGTLTGAGFLSIGSYFDWSGGTITGTGGAELAGTGTGSLSGSNGAMVLDGRTFNNYGSLAFNSPTNPLNINNGALFRIYGVMTLNTDGTIGSDLANGAQLSIDPNGYLIKSGGSGTFTIDPFTANSASVYVNSGELLFAHGGSHTGYFYQAAGAKLTFSGSSTQLNSGSVVSGDGTVSFSGCTAYLSGYYSNDTTLITASNLYVNSSASTKNLTFTSGTIHLDDDFLLTAYGTWSGGTMSGSDGAFVVESGATLTIDAASGTPTLYDTYFENDGVVNYTAAAAGPYLTLSNGAYIANEGTFDLQTDAAIVSTVWFGGGDALRARASSVTRSPSRHVTLLLARRIRPSGIAPAGGNFFQNDVTLEKSGGSGSSEFGPSLSNSGSILAKSGTLAFDQDYSQTAGSTTLGPGSISVPSTVVLSGGVLNGSGTFTGSVQNDAEVAPGTISTGTIAITGNYSQGTTGTLTVRLNGPSAGQFDQLTAGAAAALDGTFTATLGGSYVPADGTTWPVLTYASVNGTFATQNLPTYPPHGVIVSNYGPSSYTLTAVSGPSAADLLLSMNGPATVNGGSPLAYTIDVSNLSGDTTAGTISVSNTLPAGATSATGAGSGWTCGSPAGNVITCTTTTALPAGQALPTLTISMTAPVAGGSVQNSATVTSPITDPNPANNSATVSTNVAAVPQADLKITKSGPASVTAGQNVTYTIVVTNAGPTAAASTVVTDPTPIGLAFQSNTGACTVPFPCSLGTLAANQTATIVSTYTIPANYAGTAVTNTASVSSSVNDPNTADNSSSATTNVSQQADLSITKSGPPSASPGQNITYTIVVTNAGPGAAGSITVSDVTPAGLTFVSATGGCTTGFPCSIGVLAAGQSATISATYSIPSGYATSTVSNTASVASGANDPTASNNSATVVTPVVAQADLSITKSGPASFTPGQTITYTITVTNSGPLSATNSFVTDNTPAGLQFVSNSGGCTGPFPCALGTLTPSQSVTISATYMVPAGYAASTISNTATVSSSTFDANSSNDSATATSTSTLVPFADVSVDKRGPARVDEAGFLDFTITVRNVGTVAATGVVLSDPTPPELTFVSASGACSTFPCSIGTLAAGQVVTTFVHYFVPVQGGRFTTNTATVSSGSFDANSTNNSSSVQVQIFPKVTCPTAAALPVSPAGGIAVTSPVTLTWTAIDNATAYTVTLLGGTSPISFTTPATSRTLVLSAGSYSWTVTANGSGSCAPVTSSAASFIVCDPAGGTTASVVAETATGQTYQLRWVSSDERTQATFEVQESTDPHFASFVTQTVQGSSTSFSKRVEAATAFFYRVRNLSACGGAAGDFSPVVTVVVVPLPTPKGEPAVTVPDGSTNPVTFQIFVPGLPGGTTSFIATVDKPWMAVTPNSGLITPAGTLLTLSLDPTTLSNGTWTGTLLIVYGSTVVTAQSHALATATATTTTTSIPVSISLVTPVTPVPVATTTSSALVIPSVGHLSGVGAQWRSDLRIANVGLVPQRYQLTFNAGTTALQPYQKQTIISVPAGATTALDDLVRSWYGVGSLDDSANGVLTLQPVDSSGKPVAIDVTLAKSTIASSRTYNSSQSGTLGQFIPAISFASLIGKPSATGSSVLSLQQLAQSTDYRTNLGIVEATGRPADVLVSVFNAAGTKLLAIPLSIGAGEQRQLNEFLAQNGIATDNARIEVAVTGGEGRVTAYASVVDNHTGDPLLVSGVPIGTIGATRYVIPGAANLQGGAQWRSDVRIFNGSGASQGITMTLYPTGNPTASVSRQVTLNSGEVSSLDNVIASLFNLSDIGGALHVTTDNAAPLVVTARTYSQTSQGTLGQFIPAVTASDAVGRNDRTLQIVQAEESARYRTNLGIAELSGKPAVAEISVFLPDSKVVPRVQIPLAAFESQQLPILSSLGLGAAYNARISVRVISGEGKVAAYGSVIDMTTQDPTYIPAQ
jgi:uncharacterized repeat protein (TIGR01451 family)